MAEYTYSFTYDGPFDQVSRIGIGNRTLAQYQYAGTTEAETSLPGPVLFRLDYGNNDHVQYSYDSQGRQVLETYEDGDTVSYAYDNNGALATVTDSATGRTTTYYYDFTDRLMKYAEKGSGFLHSVTYGYNQQNLLWTEEEVINGTSAKISYTYDDDNRVTQVYNSRTTSRQDYTYNDYGLVQYRRAYHGSSQVLQTHHSYRMPTGTTVTPQISTLTNTAANYSSTFQYSYDAKGNITEVINGGKSTTYVYDSANQLLRENNQAGNYTYVWAYDDAGNIVSRTEYAYTTGTLGTATDTVNYTYGDGDWGDLLTVYDGQSITYDNIGNPTSYYNGTRWSFSWEHGRELTTASNGSSTWTYTYDANGMRTKRTNGSTTYEYVYNGDRLTQMTINESGTVRTLYFVYDASGPIAFNVTSGTSSTTYYYVKNAQGDITAIVNKAGTAVVTYSYDAWGNLLSIDGEYKNGLGLRNPLRYRGYVYDTETGFYYLQSRYYDPQIGRFINADALVSTGQGLLGSNVYSYCLNSPVCRRDSQGNASEDSIDAEINLDKSPFDDVTSGGSALGFAFGMGVTFLVAKKPARKKPANLPAKKKMTIDIEHIVSGHMPNGPRNPGGNKGIFWGLTVPQLSKAIYEAYQSASKVQTQGTRIKLIGFSETYNYWIEMWIDIVEYAIKTAYPKT